MQLAKTRLEKRERLIRTSAFGFFFLFEEKEKSVIGCRFESPSSVIRYFVFSSAKSTAPTAKMEALDPAVRAMSYNWTIILDSNNMTGVPADSSPEMEDSLRCNTNDTDGYKQFYETAQMVTGLIIYPILCISGITG